MDTETLLDHWAQLACDLFEAATGESWEELDEEAAAAEGEWCHNLWLRLSVLLASRAAPPDEG